ncbi:MAG: AmmeMemoRadiSam system protein B [Spirochaetales bacterium]|nr:AmmeMemoRadiSam system protein B [Spirochaetales bacterium]
MIIFQKIFFITLLSFLVFSVFGQKITEPQTIYLSDPPVTKFDHWTVSSDKYRDLFGDDKDFREPDQSACIPLGGIISHHNLLGPLLARYFNWLSEKRKNIKHIVIIGPDHYSRSQKGINIGTGNFHWNGKTVLNDYIVSNDWIRKLHLEIDGFPFYEEHSITTFIPFISRYFPTARVTPVIIRHDCPLRLLKELSSHISRYLTGYSEQAFILVSIDFCHNLSRDETDKRDKINRGIIVSLPHRFSCQLTCDSKRSFYVLANSLKEYEKKVHVLFHTDNEVYLGKHQENITSYFFSAVYCDVNK